LPRICPPAPEPGPSQAPAGQSVPAGAQPAGRGPVAGAVRPYSSRLTRHPLAGV